MIRGHSATALVAVKGVDTSQALTKCLKIEPAYVFHEPFSLLLRGFLAAVSWWSMASRPLDHAEQERRKPLLRLHSRARLGMIWNST